MNADGRALIQFLLEEQNDIYAEELAQLARDCRGRIRTIDASKRLDRLFRIIRTEIFPEFGK